MSVVGSWVGRIEEEAMADVKVLAEGLGSPEGPIARPGGSVIFVETFVGRLTSVDPDGHLAVVAEVQGGPNGAAAGPDGAIYVCNNGGARFSTKPASDLRRGDLGRTSR